MSTPDAATQLKWAESLKRYPMDPVFPDGKPYSIRIQELEAEGLLHREAQDVADGELSVLGLF